MTDQANKVAPKSKNLLISLIAVLSVLVLCVAAFGTYYIFNNSAGDASLKQQLQKVEAELEQAKQSGNAMQAQIAELQQQRDQLLAQIAALEATATPTPTVEPTGSPEPTLDPSLQPSPSTDVSASATAKPNATDEPTGDDPNATYPEIELPDVNPSDANLKLVALTYDDGPGKYTSELLDYLKQEGVKATFFVINYNATKYKSLLARMVEEGHVVGNHSNKHDNLKKMTTKQQIRDAIEQCNKTIEEATGKKVTVMRPPGGNYDDLVKQVTKEMGMAIIHWQVDTLDWQSRDPEKIMQVAFDKNSSYSIKDGSIVLMHDIYQTTLEATKQMIPRLKAEGYTFVTVPELLTLRGGMVAGQVYKKAFPTS